LWNAGLAKVVSRAAIVLAIGIGVCIVLPRQSGEKASRLLAPGIERSYVASMDDIKFAEVQMVAVTIDMDRYLGWFPDEKDIIEQASIKAVSDLKEVERYLNALQLTGDLAELRDTQLAILPAMTKYYDGVEARSDADCTAMMADIKALYAKYAERLAAMAKDTMPNAESLEAYMPAMWEPNAKDWDMSDAEMEKEINAMEGVLDSGRYSPMLVKTFIDWRMRTQILFYGISNMSEIPNWKYNLKRWQVIRTIRKHLKANPSDSSAARQAGILLSLENIGRGGPFGNNVLNYLADTNL
jgi:hypothetical protein